MNSRMYYSREAEMQANRERAGAVLVFLALGLGIGALMALLFAPKSGDKTRAELTDALEDRVDAGRDATNKAISRLEKDFSDLRKRVEDRLAEK